jgi:hypothetical protein
MGSVSDGFASAFDTNKSEISAVFVTAEFTVNPEVPWTLSCQTKWCHSHFQDRQIQISIKLSSVIETS